MQLEVVGRVSETHLPSGWKDNLVDKAFLKLI